MSQESGVPGFAGVVALDGPSGTGKSTVARQLATQLGARYLDTGAMYRAATLAVLRAGVDLSDDDAIAETVRRATIEISTDPLAACVRLDGEEVDGAIRTAGVTRAVSAVSAVPAVRTQLVAAQRKLIEAGGIVVEGRDTASVVWPAAWPKVFLTANAGVRARRRAHQLGQAEIAAVRADLDRRDTLDSTRSVSPLSRAADAVEMDTTDLSIDEVVKQLVDMAMAPHIDSHV
jgi:CMP/dCMP kinase